MTLAQHIVVGIVGDGVDVGRHLSLALVLVAHDDVVVVDGEPLVGVDGDTEETGVGVDQEKLVARLQVVDNGGLKSFVKCDPNKLLWKGLLDSKLCCLTYLGQVGHVGHILQQLVLWRVLWLDILGLEQLDFTVNETLDLDFAVLLLTSLLTLGVTGLSVWNPAGGTTFEWSIAEFSHKVLFGNRSFK